MSSPALSIVFPARNEAKRLPPTLRAAAKALGHIDHECIVVSDRSTDETVAVAKALGAKTLEITAPGGAAAAMRAGVMAARGERILISDADGAVPFEDLDPLWHALDQGYDIAVGSRALRREKVEIPQPLHRRIMGRVWGRMVRSVLPPPVKDTQCGFKLFAKEHGQRLFAQSRSRGFACYPEVLAMAAQQGLSIAEIPVRWRDREGSQINLLSDPATMAWELLQARWHLRRMGAQNRHVRRRQNQSMGPSSANGQG